MRRLMLAAVFGLMALDASAQGVSVRFYFVPKIGDGLSSHSAFRPKYTDPGDLGVGLDVTGWSTMDYGAENLFLLGADVTPEQHTALSAQVDVLAVPALDSNVSGVALSTVQDKLEAMNLPGSWVMTSLTYRQVVRTVAKIILFMQRYNGQNGAGRLFGAGVTLDTQWNQLSQAERTRLRAVADSFGIDYSAVTNSMNLRQILRLLGDQLPALSMQGEVL